MCYGVHVLEMKQYISYRDTIRIDAHVILMYTMVKPYIKGIPRCIFTHIHRLCEFVYIYSPLYFLFQKVTSS